MKKHRKILFPTRGWSALDCHRHGLACRRQLERLQRANGGLCSGRRRIVVERLAERQTRTEGDGDREREQPVPKRTARPRPWTALCWREGAQGP
jgi:hypothetical protein